MNQHKRKPKPIDLTIDELKNRLHYDPETGLFTWKSSGKKNKYVIGKSAGHFRKDGYLEIRVNYKLYLAHRLAWFYVTGEETDLHIDHINRNPSDNRFCNLRKATNQQNTVNSRLRKSNTSGFKGVSFFRRDNNWKAAGMLNGKMKHIGYFDTPEEASIAYQNFTEKQHGEYVGVVRS